MITTEIYDIKKIVKKKLRNSFRILCILQEFIVNLHINMQSLVLFT